eukprot:441961-Hanusia_phi.AAC.2
MDQKAGGRLMDQKAGGRLVDQKGRITDMATDKVVLIDEDDDAVLLRDLLRQKHAVYHGAHRANGGQARGAHASVGAEQRAHAAGVCGGGGGGVWGVRRAAEPALLAAGACRWQRPAAGRGRGRAGGVVGSAEGGGPERGCGVGRAAGGDEGRAAARGGAAAAVLRVRAPPARREAGPARLPGAGAGVRRCDAACVASVCPILPCQCHAAWLCHPARSSQSDLPAAAGCVWHGPPGVRPPCTQRRGGPGGAARQGAARRPHQARRQHHVGRPWHGHVRARHAHARGTLRLGQGGALPAGYRLRALPPRRARARRYAHRQRHPRQAGGRQYSLHDTARLRGYDPPLPEGLRRIPPGPAPAAGARAGMACVR